MFVKPKTGLKIPDPALLDYLPEDGREVESSAYWIRRLRDGDVIEVDTVAALKKNEGKS